LTCTWSPFVFYTYNTCSIESASVVSRIGMYQLFNQIKNFKMSNHFMLSMSVKVLAISFKIFTILSSVDDDWFIRPYWGELELDATGLNTTSSGSKVVGNIFRKSLRLSGRARNEHSIGQITTMISSDATHLDLFTGFAHQSVSFFRSLILYYWS
jgi:hypothetical protein